MVPPRGRGQWGVRSCLGICRSSNAAPYDWSSWLDPDRAFEFLVRTSQNGNVRLCEVAAALVADTIREAE
jgi:hypothetical protein